MRKYVVAVSIVMMLALIQGPISAVSESNGGSQTLKTEKYTGTASEISLNYTSEESMLQAMSLVSENSKYALYCDTKTLMFALKNKTDNQVFLSNPYNAAQDAYYNGNIKNDLNSIASIHYLDKGSNEIKQLWSSADCVAFGQFDVKTTDDGMVYEMALGQIKSERLIPKALTTERYNEIVQKLPSREARKMSFYYAKYSLSSMKDEATKDQMLKEYPQLENMDIYILGELNERESEELEQALTESGYTSEDFQKDREMTGTKAEQQVFPSFTMNMVYKLTEDGLTVTVPNSSITYDHSHYTILSVGILQYFGADLSDSASDGYLFIPDGSGSIISFNDKNENRRRVITGTVYGNNIELTQTVDAREGEQYYLPVFGIRRNNQSALFANISKGDEIAEITARLGDPNSNYYTVYANFILSPDEYIIYDTKVASHNSSIRAYKADDNLYKGDLTISYTPLSGDQANYVGMAKLYRETLKGQRTKQSSANTMSLGLDVLGSSYYEGSFLGFPVQKQVVYTSYKQTKDLGNYFISNGVKNAQISYLGWQNRGLNAGLGDQGKVSHLLGGTDGFNQLNDWAQKENIPLYVQNDFQFVSYDYMFDGFSKYFNACKQLDGTFAGVRTFEPDISKFGDVNYAVLPQKYAKYSSDLLNKIQKLHVHSLSLANMGTYLPSNCNDQSSVNRGQTKEIIQDLLKNDYQDYSLEFNGANAYILPYANTVKGIPYSDSGYVGETYSVPFLQIVLSGVVDYQSEPINLSDNWQVSLLHCAETRTSPVFILANQNISELKHSDFSKYYSVDFARLKSDILNSYRELENKLSVTAGHEITDHSYIDQNVTCTVYDNGTKVYINYNTSEYKKDNLVIPALDCYVE